MPALGASGLHPMGESFFKRNYFLAGLSLDAVLVLLAVSFIVLYRAVYFDGTCSDWSMMSGRRDPCSFSTYILLETLLLLLGGGVALWWLILPALLLPPVVGLVMQVSKPRAGWR